MNTASPMASRPFLDLPFTIVGFLTVLTGVDFLGTALDIEGTAVTLAAIGEEDELPAGEITETSGVEFTGGLQRNKTFIYKYNFFINII